MSMAAVTTESVVAALALWDSRRDRSLQTEVGASELGGCRRRVAYRLADEPHTDAPYKGAALVGTAIHEQLLPIIAEQLGMASEFELPGDTPGHADLAGLTSTGTLAVVDLKTKAGVAYEHACRTPVSTEWRWQLGTYANTLAAAFDADPATVELSVIILNRDNGEVHVRNFLNDPTWGAEAIEWLDEVRTDTETLGWEFVPKDRPGPKDEHCQGCPWLTRCWGEQVERETIAEADPFIAATVDAYVAALQAENEAGEAKAKARARLADLTYDEGPGGRRVSYSGGKTTTKEDPAGMKAILEAAGIAVPTKAVTGPERINVRAAKRDGL